MKPQTASHVPPSGRSGSPCGEGFLSRVTPVTSPTAASNERLRDPLWNAVADAIRANAKSMSEMMSGGMMGSSQTATLPEKLALREKIMTGHLEALRKFKVAIDPLYAALSSEQKKTADELLMGPMGMGMMM